MNQHPPWYLDHSEQGLLVAVSLSPKNVRFELGARFELRDPNLVKA